MNSPAVGLFRLVGALEEQALNHDEQQQGNQNDRHGQACHEGGLVHEGRHDRGCEVLKQKHVTLLVRGAAAPRRDGTAQGLEEGSGVEIESQALLNAEAVRGKNHVEGKPGLEPVYLTNGLSNPAIIPIQVPVGMD